jgi:hypothetical protein
LLTSLVFFYNFIIINVFTYLVTRDIMLLPVIWTLPYLDFFFSSSATAYHAPKSNVRPCLVPKIFCEIFHISYHIESCGTYIEH